MFVRKLKSCQLGERKSLKEIIILIFWYTRNYRTNNKIFRIQNGTVFRTGLLFYFRPAK